MPSRHCCIVSADLVFCFFVGGKVGITYVLNNMAVIADEEDSAAVGKVDLHSYQTVRVAWEVVQRDALAEVEAALVEGLPVPVCEY
jgi:hypothetical protein